MTDPAPDRSAFEAEVLPQLDSLYRLALRLTTDPSRAEDLVQDTVLKAFRSWQSFQPGTNIRSWLFTILRNTFINDYRRRQREPIAMDLDAVEPHAAFRAAQDEDPEGTFFSQIVDAKVLDAIDAPAVPEQEKDHAGIERSAACTHRQPIQGREAHGGIHALAVSHGA